MNEALEIKPKVFLLKQESRKYGCTQCPRGRAIANIKHFGHSVPSRVRRTRYSINEWLCLNCLMEYYGDNPLVIQWIAEHQL